MHVRIGEMSFLLNSKQRKIFIIGLKLLKLSLMLAAEKMIIFWKLKMGGQEVGHYKMFEMIWLILIVVGRSI